MDIRKRSSIGSVRESDLLIVPLGSQRQHNFGRGKGQYFHHVSEGVRERRLSALVDYKLLQLPLRRAFLRPIILALAIVEVNF